MRLVITKEKYKKSKNNYINSDGNTESEIELETESETESEIEQIEYYILKKNT